VIRLYLSFVMSLVWIMPAQALDISTRTDKNDLAITVHWENLPVFSVSNTGREILLRFKSGIDAAPFLKLPETSPDWISNVETGYDTVLLYTTRDAEYKLNTSAAYFILTISPAPLQKSLQTNDKVVAAAVAEAERVRERQNLRLVLLKSRALIEDGAFESARASLQEIIRQNPDYIEAQLALADLETRAGRWHKALQTYNRVLSKVEDPGAIVAKENLLYAHGQYLTIQPKWSKQRDSYNQRSVVASGRIFAGPELDISFEMEKLHANIGQATRPDNGQLIDSKATEERIKVTAGFRLPTGQESSVSLHTTGAKTGISAKAEGRLFKGKTTLDIGANVPYWDTVEGILWDGTKDSVRMTNQWELIPSLLSLNLSSGFNSYSVQGHDYASSSIPLVTSLSFTPQINDGFLSLYYTVDAEYGFWATQGTNLATNTVFRPFDIGRREFHTVGAFYSKELSDYLSAEGSLSYTIDRIDWGRGPGITFGLTYRPIKSWEFGIRGSRSEVSAGAGGTTGKTHSGSAYATLHF